MRSPAGSWPIGPSAAPRPGRGRPPPHRVGTVDSLVGRPRLAGHRCDPGHPRRFPTCPGSARSSRSVESLRAWHATADTAADAVRTCFRILPPGVGDESDGEDAGNGGRRHGDGDDESGSARAEGGRRPSWPAATGRSRSRSRRSTTPAWSSPAPAVWADGPELTALERHVAHPDEVLLRGLGLAARLVPSLGPRWPRRRPRSR